MKKIANIVSNVELVNHSKLEYINYYNHPFELNGLPTLFVGWEDLRKFNINSLSLNILNKEIENNKLYWEFSFDEKKSDHVNGISMFINNVFYYFFSGYNYKLIDPIFDSIENINHLISILSKYTIKCSYNYMNKMIYMLDINDNIIGIDLTMFNYYEVYGVDQYIGSISNLYNDIDGQIYDKYLKVFPQYESNIKRNIVVLLSKTVL